MQQFIPSDTVTPVYDSKCDVLHMTPDTPRSIVPELACNYLVSSHFSNFETQLFLAPGLGLKYVPEGKETYWIKDRKLEVTGGKYLLVNESVGKVEARVKGAETWGMCVNIGPEVLNDLLLQVICPNNLDDMKNLQRYFLSPELLVRENRAGENLQHFLKRLIPYTTSQPLDAPPIELVYETASVLIRENLDLIGSYYKLETAKLSTRQELFRRLLLGKEILNDSLFETVSVGQVADMCCLSEFRFFRLFKQCFGQSPYHYLTQQRIGKSLELKKQDLSWNEIAYQLNFTDLAAFSKTFKKITGVPPSRYGI